MSDGTHFDYERTDVEGGMVAWLGAGLAFFVITTPLIMPLLFPQSMRHQTPLAPPALSADAPRLEIAPKEELTQFKRGEAQFEESYGWTNRDRGEVRIPLERAMELLTQRGLPGWPSP